jgi:hypothetical protein
VHYDPLGLDFDEPISAATRILWCAFLSSNLLDGNNDAVLLSADVRLVHARAFVGRKERTKENLRDDW